MESCLNHTMPIHLRRGWDTRAIKNTSFTRDIKILLKIDILRLSNENIYLEEKWYSIHPFAILFFDLNDEGI